MPLGWALSGRSQPRRALLWTRIDEPLPPLSWLPPSFVRPCTAISFYSFCMVVLPSVFLFSRFNSPYRCSVGSFSRLFSRFLVPTLPSSSSLDVFWGDGRLGEAGCGGSNPDRRRAPVPRKMGRVLTRERERVRSPFHLLYPFFASPQGPIYE